jgi:hypothetical protein
METVGIEPWTSHILGHHITDCATADVAFIILVIYSILILLNQSDIEF